MVYKTLSRVEIGSADIGVSYTGWSGHVHARRVGGRLLDGLGAFSLDGLGADYYKLI